MALIFQLIVFDGSSVKVRRHCAFFYRPDGTIGYSSNTDRLLPWLLRLLTLLFLVLVLKVKLSPKAGDGLSLRLLFALLIVGHHADVLSSLEVLC